MALYTAAIQTKERHYGTVLDIGRWDSIFCPPRALQQGYRDGIVPWDVFAEQYREQLRDLWRRDHDYFDRLLAMAHPADLTLVCAGCGHDPGLWADETAVACHRRLLAEVLVTLARRRGLDLSATTPAAGGEPGGATREGHSRGSPPARPPSWPDRPLPA